MEERKNMDDDRLVQMMDGMPDAFKSEEFTLETEKGIAANFQSCAGLQVIDKWSELARSGRDGLGAIYQLQYEVQRDVYKIDFDSLQADENKLMEFVNWNWNAQQDEIRELYTALGGMSKWGMAFWKTWKSDHKKAQADGFSHLTDTDRLEAWFELIDLLHFHFNVGHAFGIEGRDIWMAYGSTVKGAPRFGGTGMPAWSLSMYAHIGKGAPWESYRSNNAMLLTYIDNRQKEWQQQYLILFDFINGSPMGERTFVEEQEIHSVWCEALVALLKMAKVMGMGMQDIVNMYFSKNAHNIERQNRPGGY
jgi:hypothetical protein